MTLKKIISLIMATVIILSAFSVCANATSTVISSQDIETLMSGELRELFVTLKTVPGDFGLSLNDVQNAYIGQSFSIADYISNGTCEAINNIIYLPIINNNKIIALATITKSEENFSCSLGKKFASQLEEILKSSDSEIALVCDEMDIIAVSSEGEIDYIIDYPDNNNTETFCFNESCRSNNVIDPDTIYTMSYQLPTVSPQVSRAYNYFSSYPIVYQGSYNICWAAVVASMVMFKLPSQYPELYATAVCNKIGHSYTAGTVNDVISALRAYLTSYTPTRVSRALTQSEIKAEIDSGDPSCIFLTATGASMGHCVALCGYRSTSSTFQVRYMDPYYQEFEFAAYSSSGFVFTFGSNTYSWVETVKI